MRPPGVAGNPHAFASLLCFNNGSDMWQLGPRVAKINAKALGKNKHLTTQRPANLTYLMSTVFNGRCTQQIISPHCCNIKILAKSVFWKTSDIWNGAKVARKQWKTTKALKFKPMSLLVEQRQCHISAMTHKYIHCKSCCPLVMDQDRKGMCSTAWYYNHTAVKFRRSDGRSKQRRLAASWSRTNSSCTKPNMAKYWRNLQTSANWFVALLIDNQSTRSSGSVSGQLPPNGRVIRENGFCKMDPLHFERFASPFSCNANPAPQVRCQPYTV